MFGGCHHTIPKYMSHDGHRDGERNGREFRREFLCVTCRTHEGSLKMLSSPKCRWGNRHLERTCPGYTASRRQSYLLSNSLSAARLALSMIFEGKIILSKFSGFHKWEVPAALFAIPSTSFRFQRARISLGAGSSVRHAVVPKTAEDHILPGLLYSSVGVDNQSKGTPPSAVVKRGWQDLSCAHPFPVREAKLSQFAQDILGFKMETFFAQVQWTLHSQANRDGWSHYSLPSSEFLYLVSGKRSLLSHIQYK